MSRDRYDDDLVPSPAALGPLDKTFRDTNIVVLILFSVCCGVIALALGLVGVFTAKDPKAKSNATLVAIISGVLTLVWLALNFLGVLGGFAAGNR